MVVVIISKLVMIRSKCFVSLICKALVYECLPSRSRALNFLRSPDGPLPGKDAARKIVLIGAPKNTTKLPLCIADPMQVESCLLVLAQLDTSLHEYIVCPGANKLYPARRAERSTTFYSEGIRMMTLRKEQLIPFHDPTNSAPKTINEVNRRHGLKLTIARAKCIVEIHRAKIENRVEDFTGYVDPKVSGWPFDYSIPGMKMIMVWEDEEDRRHVSICPCIKELVRHCSGATSMAPTSSITT